MPHGPFADKQNLRKSGGVDFSEGFAFILSPPPKSGSGIFLSVLPAGILNFHNRQNITAG